jgi:hypothetical protein
MYPEFLSKHETLLQQITAKMNAYFPRQLNVPTSTSNTYARTTEFVPIRSLKDQRVCSARTLSRNNEEEEFNARSSIKVKKNEEGEL